MHHNCDSVFYAKLSFYLLHVEIQLERKFKMDDIFLLVPLSF